MSSDLLTLSPLNCNIISIQVQMMLKIPDFHEEGHRLVSLTTLMMIPPKSCIMTTLIHTMQTHNQLAPQTLNNQRARNRQENSVLQAETVAKEIVKATNISSKTKGIKRKTWNVPYKILIILMSTNISSYYYIYIDKSTVRITNKTFYKI